MSVSFLDHAKDPFHGFLVPEQGLPKVKSPLEKLAVLDDVLKDGLDIVDFDASKEH